MYIITHLLVPPVMVGLDSTCDNLGHNRHRTIAAPGKIEMRRVL